MLTVSAESRINCLTVMLDVGEWKCCEQREWSGGDGSKHLLSTIRVTGSVRQ